MDETGIPSWFSFLHAYIDDSTCELLHRRKHTKFATALKLLLIDSHKIKTEERVQKCMIVQLSTQPV